MAVYPRQQTPIIMNNSTGWFNSDYFAGVVVAQPADATPVGTWVNLGGNRLTAAQASGTSQPFFKTNVNAGKSGILFDGSNDSITISGASPLTAAQRFASTAVFSLVITFRCLSITASGQVLESMRGSVSTDKTTVGVDAAGILYFQVQNAGVITLVSTAFSETTNPHVVIVTNDGANGLNLYLDGVTAVGNTGTPTTSGTASTVSMGNIPGLTRPLNGYIFDFMHFSKVLSSAERTSINRFFSNLRGVAI